MRGLTGFIVLALVCGVVHAAPSLDGYSFDKPEYEHDRVTVTFVPVRTESEMKQLAGTFGFHPNGVVKAFSILSKDSCVIYAEDPRISYEPEFLGHELTHCIFGHFHPGQTEGAGSSRR